MFTFSLCPDKPVGGYICEYVLSHTEKLRMLRETEEMSDSHSETYPSPHFPVYLFAWELFK